MKKELLISAKFDTSDFDRSVDSMQKKLREMYQPSDMIRMQRTSQALQQAGYGTMAGAPGQGDVQSKTNEYRRNLDKFIREEKIALEGKVKNLTQEQASYKKINEEYQKVIKLGKEDLKLKEQLKNVQEALSKAKEEELDSETKINAFLKEKQRLSQSGGGGAGGAGGGGGFPGAGMNFGNIAKGLGLVGTIAAATGSAIQYISELPMRRTEMLGNAQQSIYGGQLQDISSGNVVNLIAQSAKREEALKRANKISESRQVTDLFSGGLQDLFSGGLTRGAELWGGNILGQLANEQRPGTTRGRGQNPISKFLGGVSEDLLSTYHANIEQMRGVDYERILAGLNKQDPLLNLASQRLQSRGEGDLATQRLMGLSDEGMFGRGGFQETANKGGFNQDIRAQMAAQIAAAGGSTRAMRGESSMLSLQAQRNFDLTNAGTVMGRISGTAGGTQASNEIFKRLLESSVKAGLDSSEFREEQRKFADVTSSIISSAGTTSATDASSVLENFRTYLGGQPTMKGIQGAQSAYQEAQQFSAETSGRGGALQFAAMAKQGLSSIGALGMGGLMEMPENQLSADDPYVIAQAVKAGITPQELVEKVKAAKKEKRYTEIGLSQSRVKDLHDYLSKQGLPSELSEDQLKGLPEQQRQEYFEVQQAAAVRSQYESPQKRAALVRSLIAGGQAGEEYGPSAREAVEQKLGMKAERISDKEIEASGIAAQSMLENFRDFKKALDPANISFNELIKNVILFQQVMSTTSEKDKAATQQWMAEHFKNAPPPRNQGQGGKPSQ